MQDFIHRTSNGGRPISGPLLVLQGLADTNIDPGTTNRAVTVTCSAYPRSQIRYETWDAISHDPVMYASQQVWLQWIADRFDGVPVPEQCSTFHHSPVLSQQRYQPEASWIVESETELYKLAIP